MTRDTVVLETPASLAISLIVYDITLSQRCAQNYASDGTGTFRRQFLKVPVPSDLRRLTHQVRITVNASLLAAIYHPGDGPTIAFN
jgi:hypothetical protein